MRRRLAAEKEKALKENREHPYNPLRPWAEVFVQLAQCEDTWWRQEMEAPCQHVSTGAAKIKTFVAGDMLVATAASSLTADSTLSAVAAPPPPPSSSADSSTHLVIHNKRPPVEQHAAAADDGEGLVKHKVNNDGAPLCEAFNLGRCQGLGPKSRCKVDGKSVRQCWYCKSNRHPGCECPMLTSQKRTTCQQAVRA